MRISLVIGFLLSLFSGVAGAGNVEVILACGGCQTFPDPAVIYMGDTLTLTCAPDCGASGCIVTDNGGSISGVTPFNQFLSAGETGSALGPATAGGEYAAILVSNNVCFPAFHGSLETAVDISTLPSSGVVVAWIFMFAVGLVVVSRRRPSGQRF
jgi:hypothetical protein